MLQNEIQRYQRTVKDHNGTWDTPSQCEKFTHRLCGMVEELTTKNRKLRGVHLALADNMLELMDTDLLNIEVWQENLKKLLALFPKEER